MNNHPLQQQGLINISYPEELREQVEKAIDSWKFFCRLKTDEKTLFSFLEDNYGDGAGYELKEEKKALKDFKENFHVTLFQYERLKNIANKNSFLFLNDAKNLLDKIEPLVCAFAEDVEKTFKVEGLVEEVIYSKPFWILRYLHYFGNQETGYEIAAPHTDKGGFTLHLYESDDGLQHFCIHTKVWKAMPVYKKQTVIIPAIQLQLRSEGRLKGLYHRVVASKKTASEGRFSMVCFIPFQKTPLYNKKKFGSMQIHPVGFNYDMPHEELQLFFNR